MSATANGGPDWGLAFAEFHARHRDVKGRKLVFTAIFNTSMEAFIACPEVPLVWRVLAWIWRYAWGNDSDYCVDKIGGSPLGQQACADHFQVDKRRVHDCVALLRGLNFILPANGHKLYPVDDPSKHPQKDPNTTDVESPDPSGLFKQACDEWKVRALADFQELESAEATVNRLKIVRLVWCRKWIKARSIHALPIKGLTSQQVMEAVQPIDKPIPSSSAVVVVVVQPEKAEEEDSGPPYEQFKEAYPRERFDEPKAKPSFERKTKAEQARILDRLQIYLSCDRWRDDEGKWIPFASKWLESYEADPPPVLKKAPPKQSTKDAVIEEAKRRYAKYGRI